MPRGPGGVVVLGEVLVELSALSPWKDGGSLRLAFSGDALNAAAASAAAGAHTVLVARVPDDELGDALVQRVAELGIDTRHLIRTGGQHGVYLSHADPEGLRQFAYARKGSAGSELSPEDLDEDLLRGAGVVLGSGVACAISPSAAAAVHRAAEIAPRFVYDPNFRPRLTSARDAAEHLRRLAPLAEVVTPSWPGEVGDLLGLPAQSAAEAVQGILALGARDVVLTCGSAGVLLWHAGTLEHIPGVHAPLVVDQTGAGDCLTGTLVARLAVGDDLAEAARLAVAAAALSVQGQGGTGHIPTLDETRSARAAASLQGADQP
ncbi:2-keto-3-deoxygluconate kinase [Knoellia sp. Soil729]|nr:2-keto-3-deoxygluconate kinase [Knoellia sp. Soil729]